MPTPREISSRLRAFFNKSQRDQDLEAEIQTHLALAIEDNIHQGMSPEEAHRKALIRFGGVQQAREQHRATRGLPWLDTVLQDLRFTLRTLRRDLGFTIVAILILALGVGANIAVFSVVNTILLRPLPFPQSDRLVWIASTESKGLSSMTYSADAYDDLQAMNQSYSSVAGYNAFSTTDNVKLTRTGEPIPLTGISVTGNFFRTLGISPILGRDFTPDEYGKGGDTRVLITYPFWQRQFQSNLSIIGRAITLNGQPTTVIGVLPPSFDFGAVFSPGTRVDLFGPQMLDDIRMNGNTLALIGRLKPGITVKQAQAEAVTLFPKFYWSKKYPDSLGSYTAHPGLLKEYISGKLRRSLIVLWAAVGLILLIVCVNLANLLLARAATRNKEFALRSALGAGRARLIRQLLTESLVLSSAGALLGLAFAYAITSYIAHQGSIALPLLSSIKIDAAALAWTVLITIAAATFFGLLPALRMSLEGLQEALKDGGKGTTDGRRHEGLRSALVISEVALACVLLISAGLLLKSFLQVLDVDLGFQPATAATIKVDYDLGNTKTRQEALAKQSSIFQGFLHRIASVPGVQAAGISDNLPLERNRSWGAPGVKGKTYRNGELPDAFVYIITPGYLQAMGMHLRGRDVSWSDIDTNEHVIILNESAAHGLFPDQDPVGRIVMNGKTEERIIGVIADIHESSAEAQPNWQMYLPVTQEFASGAELVVHTTLPPAQLGPTILRALRELNPGQPAVEFRTIQTIVDHSVSPRRFFVLLVAAFAALGLILASLGIYGVISYSVTRRTQEIGVRMALGATAAKVQLGIISKTLKLAAIGIAVGIVGSIIAANLIGSMLFGTAPTDALTYLLMVTLLCAVALLAGYMPARRASRINPMVALRNN